MMKIFIENNRFISGIPYFAYMMSVISDLINGKMDQLRKLIERNTTKMVPCYFIPIIYTIVGFIFLIVVPSIIFTIMEGICVGGESIGG